jgi:hypothetical protein
MAFANIHASMVAVGDTQLQCYEAGSGDPMLLLSGWPESALRREPSRFGRAAVRLAAQ